MKMSVVVPSYQRPQDLKNCIGALKTQSRLPDEIIIVVRKDDIESQKMLQENFRDLELLKIHFAYNPPLNVALNIGLKAAQGDILSFMDDDAIPPKHWLQTIEKIFLEDEKIGGVGGPDRYVRQPELYKRPQNLKVGKISFWGSRKGNHHLGTTTRQEVDNLKGVNMSFRRAAIGNIIFDENLLGQGAQTHNELQFSLQIKKRGWRLVYDPEVWVDHYLSPRAGDLRVDFSPQRAREYSFNECKAIWMFLPVYRRPLYFIFTFLFGSRYNPGLCRTLLGFFQWGPKYLRYSLFSFKGKLEFLMKRKKAFS